MGKQLMLLSLPNSGSDWFARTVCAANPDVKYFREYFNPITNVRHLDLLATEFGCEMASTMGNIVTFNKERAEKVYQETWGKTDFNFTKENYSAFKVEFWTQKFTCFAMTRDVEYSFPASRRGLITTIYDSIYQAMLSNMEHLPTTTRRQMLITENTVEALTNKIIMAYVIYKNALIENCKKYNVPVLKWENLMGDKYLVYEELKKVPFIDTESWTKVVLDTRCFSKKDFNSYNFNPQNVLNKLTCAS